MSQLYSRVFIQILDSSIAEDFTMRHIFEDFLKLADFKSGVVDMTRQSISRRLNIPIEILNDHISRLESADPASRDGENDGRRIERIDSHRDWGWKILNWGKYECLKNREDVAFRVAKHRESRKKVEGKPLVEVFAAEDRDDQKYHKDARSALHILNQESGKTFREVDSNLTIISARLREDGVDIAGISMMIKRQCALWKNDPKMSEFLRPETLFGKSKFDSYYASKSLPIQIGGRDGISTARPNVRNEGVVVGPTDYADAGQRRMREASEALQQRREAETQGVAGEVAQT